MFYWRKIRVKKFFGRTDCINEWRRSSNTHDNQSEKNFSFRNYERACKRRSFPHIELQKISINIVVFFRLAARKYALIIASGRSNETLNIQPPHLQCRRKPIKNSDFSRLYAIFKSFQGWFPLDNELSSLSTSPNFLIRWKFKEKF